MFLPYKLKCVYIYIYIYIYILKSKLFNIFIPIHFFFIKLEIRNQRYVTTRKIHLTITIQVLLISIQA